MQQQLDGPGAVKGGPRGTNRGGNEDDDSSDDNSSYHDDDLDSTDDEDEGTVATGGKVKDLEWDNSTLAI